MSARVSTTNKPLPFVIFIMVLIFIALDVATLTTREKDEEKKQFTVRQVSDRPDSTLVNVNNISMWIYADGTSANTPGGSSGVFFPRGNDPSTAVIFQDGIIWGGIVSDGEEPTIRVGGQTYSIGTVPGSIISKGVAENFNDSNVDRIWRIRRDYPFADLRQDAAELNLKPVEEVSDSEIEAVRARYEKDWTEWPWEKGAPFYDAEGDGVYTPRFYPDGTPILFPEADEPGMADADQVVWFVANDLDLQTVKKLYGSPPIGLEMQVTLWGYRRADALGNMVFKRYRLIYKGTETTIADARIDSMYVAQWSDPDLGGAGDDFVGCDTLLNAGYVYNSTSMDAMFSQLNLPPPAVGYDILAGPIVPEPYQEAIFDLKRLAGYHNLPMTAFAFFGTHAIEQDPTRGGDYNGTWHWWNMLRGFRPRPENPPDPWTNPFTGEATTFRVPGDPVTGIGWIDDNPGDRRMWLVSGPFSIALGDTNEITIGLVAGLGSDRLMSITAMKYYDRVAQESINNLFVSTKPPPAPNLTASVLDGQIFLNWSDPQENVEEIERWQEGGHQFEGYNIYQLPLAGSVISGGIKLATYDLKNEATAIIQEQFDPQSASILTVPVQIGTNSGIVRTMLVERDEINNRPLINGQEYRFAVTSYSFNPDRQAVVKSLESEPAIVSVTPHSLNPGVRLGAAAGDTLPVVHTLGGSDGKVFPIVVDPTKLTGDEYKVTFKEYVEGRALWSLLNITKGRTLLSEMTNLTGDEDYLITEGVQVVVIGPPPGIKQQDMFDNDERNTWGWDIPQGTRRFTWSGGADGFGFEGFRGAIGWGSPAWAFGSGIQGVEAAALLPVLLVLATVADENGGYDVHAPHDPNDPNVSYGYRWGRGFSLPPAQPEFAPYIINTAGTGYDYQDYTKSVPLAAYDISDPDNPRRLAVGFLENNAVNGLVDGRYFPGSHADYNNTAGSGPREWLWIFNTDYTGETPNPDYQVEVIGAPLPIMYWLTVANRGGMPWSPNESGEDHFAIYPNNPLTEADEFTFQTKEPLFDKSRAKADLLSQVNVFPNPYYGLFRIGSRSLDRFVTFSHLPEKANIRIFNLAGILIRTIQKDSESQFERWDLLNERGRAVAGGIYIAHIEMPELGVNKIMKLAIFHK